jgi:molybdopterin adenylyltransferase
MNVIAGVLTISDKGSSGERADASGDYIKSHLNRMDISVSKYGIIPDETSAISATLIKWVDEGDINLIFTTGGTGLAPRDVTPEATRAVIEREVPGIVDVMRCIAFSKTPNAILSRAIAGVRGRCLIINLPGSPRAVKEYLEIIMPVIPHAIDTLLGKIGDHE